SGPPLPGCVGGARLHSLPALAARAESYIFPLTFVTVLSETRENVRSLEMTTSLPLFPTTVVGSMPRPQYVKDLLRAGSRTGQHDAGWQRRMDDAVRFVIGMQEQAGIDILSDGEWRRETYVDVVAEILDGFEWVQRDV